MSYLKATIHAGKRSYSESLDVDEELEHWNEIEDQCEFDWEHWTRPIMVPYEEIRKMAGDHILFGWLEATMQSDFSPWNCLTTNNDSNIVLEFN